MKVYLDNQIIANPVESLQNPSITLRRQTETGEIGFSFTGDLIFSGKEYDYLYAQLVQSATALENKVVLRFENDCCSNAQIYEFNVTYKGLKWCENKCELNAAAVEKTTAEDKLTCLKNTLIWDDYNGFKSKQHPRFAYCNELRPDWMHDVLIILSVATATQIVFWIPLIASLVLLFNTVNAVISFLNNNLNTNINQISIGGNTQITINDLQNQLNLLYAFIVGCGRKHPAPLVRDYATNVCGKCGLNFKSSILNDVNSQYYNLCYLSAPIKKGIIETDTTTYWIDDNKPLLNGTQFFNEMKSVFNADYKINGNDLVFERRDYFVPSTPWLDLTTYPEVNEVCWTWSTKDRYSYASLYYQKDGINWVGGEAVSRWGDVVGWNVPYSANQKGEFKPLINFSASRFRDDGIDRDVLTNYEWAPSIGPVIKKYKNTILMNAHQTYTPMLLIWDTNTGVANAKVDPTAYYFAGFPDVAANQFYNYPMWFNANYPGNLYTNFWYIDNPKLTGFQGKDFSAEIIFNCELLNKIDLQGMIMTSEGKGKVNEISINFASNVMIINGTV
jgi:hypothetical protein